MTEPAQQEPLEEMQPDVAEPKAMEDELSKAQAEAAKMKDQWVRAVAEAENIRKRSQRELEDTAKYATTSFARDMVNVLENLMRATSSITPEARESSDLIKTVGEGIDLTLRELLSIFERHHIKRVDPVGEKFDHNFHQAIAQVESPDTAPGTVVQVVQAGYMIHDRLLRPAMVAVAKQGETPKHLDTKA